MPEIYETYPVIFHYTTAAGLHGILETDCLHATHYQFLNDGLEAQLLHKRVASHILPHIKSAIILASKRNPAANATINYLGGINAAAAHEADALSRSLQDATFALEDKPTLCDPFVTSFCSHASDYERENGLLSQWRAYGRDGGFAIAFDTKLLCDGLLADAGKNAYTMASFCDVVYDGDEKKFQEEFSELVMAIPKVITKNFFAEIGDKSSNVGELFGPFLTSAIRLKHRGFVEEREVRAVFSPVSEYWRQYFLENEPENYEKIKDKEINKVLLRSDLKPYIPTCCGSVVKAIKYIIVGPDALKSVRAMKLSKRLSLMGLNFEVKISDTPLV